MIWAYLVIAFWLLPAFAFIVAYAIGRIYDRGYHCGYCDCAEDWERDAIDELHRGVRKYLQEVERG